MEIKNGKFTILQQELDLQIEKNKILKELYKNYTQNRDFSLNDTIKRVNETCNDLSLRMGSAEKIIMGKVSDLNSSISLTKSNIKKLNCCREEIRS